MLKHTIVNVSVTLPIRRRRLGSTSARVSLYSMTGSVGGRVTTAGRCGRTWLIAQPKDEVRILCSSSDEINVEYMGRPPQSFFKEWLARPLKKKDLMTTKMTHLLTSPPLLWALLLSTITSSVIFLRRIFVLNRFRRPVPCIFYAAYALSIVSGVTFWATINTVQQEVWEQLVLGITSTVLSWIVLVLIVNEDLCYPTTQQLWSLLFYIITELSITIQVRLIVN